MFDWETTWQTYHLFMVKLFAATSLGGLVGVERQWRKQLAGVRTNALVSMGAACFTLFAAHLPNPGVDSVARVAAQVVSGIGFLGAGVIMKDGLNVHGLTTAATLWCSASVGILCGAGLIDLAVISTGFILVVNLALRPVSRAIDKQRRDALPIRTVSVLCSRGSEKEVKKIIQSFVDQQSGKWVSLTTTTPDEKSSVLLSKFRGPSLDDIQLRLFKALGDSDGVLGMEIK